MPPTRDPFQQPTLDNDDSYLGELRASKKLPYKNPTHLAQQQEPWSRLNSTPTITSMRRDAYYFDPEIPKDDLDFRLAALYNHHTGTFKNKSEILLNQKTTQDVCRKHPHFICGSYARFKHTDEYQQLLSFEFHMSNIPSPICQIQIKE
ncbi:PREDICTED: uncharacterized protein C1orf194 homolog isoform X4 [Rhinopithecus bieti]|uniref:uncharacterized protein C1orf194 homolog isoform X4 n=1 Tax=Rhinopithecus bieti TaxID=61621 RepID=UPI00083C3421|nr:PREDICTED: uncharacterized protein C1orf194 homolog isoform X4 [Rhinopithecus bieti]